MPEPVQSATTTIHEALSQFQANLPKLGKDKTANIKSTKGSYSYKFINLATINEAVMPLLAAVGLSFHSAPRRLDDGSYVLVGMLRHTSGETIEGCLPLFTKGTAQELGSSMTYATRYLMTAMLGIAADEDEDGADVSRAQRAAQDRPQNRARQEGPRSQPDGAQDSEAYPMPSTPAQLLNTARQQTWNRYHASNPAATTDDFKAAVTEQFGLAFDDVEAGQLATFGQAPA